MKQAFSIDTDGFYGFLYAGDQKDLAMILYVDDDPDSFIGKGAVKWFVAEQINVLAMSPGPKNKGVREAPIDHIENAVRYLKGQGYGRVGIIGLSFTAMIALAAASRIPDITLTIAATPCDVVWEGTIEEKLDGTNERPSETSSLTFHGEPLPYVPYGDRHPEFWRRVIEDGRRRGDRIAAIDMFEDSEKLHPVQEEEFIKVENIRGHLLLVGARDDVMWNTTKYITRMDERLKTHPHSCTYEVMTFEHGTHYVFPEGMAKKILPVGLDLILPFMFSEAKGYTAECRANRLAIEKRVLQLCRDQNTETDNVKTESKGE